MLQPRLIGCEARMVQRDFIRPAAVVVCFAIILSSLVSCQDLNNESIDASRIKRESVPENRDLTVLLLNDKKRNDYHTKLGRYHSVKPLIGLLTSTARTFIQDGVTTEFATQIVGTTLDNGRIYAQLLTKSSLILYNKPVNDDPVIVKPTRLPSIFDEQWNVKEDLGFIDPDKYIVKNTDYLAPSKTNVVLASKLVTESENNWNHLQNQILDEPIGRKVQFGNDITNEVPINLDVPIELDKKFEFIAQPSIFNNVESMNRQSKAYEPPPKPTYVNYPKNEDLKLDEAKVVKVKNNFDLPTFTIKNEFSPIFYYIDNVETQQSHTTEQTKTPKKLFGQNNEPRPKKTFTYAGFADFTTVVGDSVIIFTPNTETARQQNPAEVNVFPSAKHVEDLASKITFLSADIPVATSTFNAHELNPVSKATTPEFIQESKSDKVLNKSDNNLTIVNNEGEGKIQDTVTVQHNNGFNLNFNVIQPSESSIITTESTHLTDDLGVLPIEEYHSQPTEALTMLKPSSTIIETPKNTVIDDNGFNDFTKSQEESDNVGLEVTSPTENSDEIHQKTTDEIEYEIKSTTESGYSDETSGTAEDIEPTTEITHGTNDDDFCTNGIETRLTMTTEYKTLTYLTTFFIPLESTETSTSIASEVVVESNVGYMSNVVCKTDFNIEPTIVVSSEIQSTKVSNLDSEIYESMKTSSPIIEPITESTPVEQDITVVANQEPKETTTSQITTESQGNINENVLTTTTTDATPERVTTTESHVEISVATENNTIPTEKPLSNEDKENMENEIDVIYKTLYTTYTYFTTFFGDQTSSVVSHKAIETNIITSTIDLNNMNPSLLKAFSEQEIIPTSIGIGRPTVAYAQNSIENLIKNKILIESVEQEDIYNSQTPTPALGEKVASIKPDAVKTYFTTYTFFTTIYVGTDANVCSRSEIYTNYVGPEELLPTKVNDLTANTRAQYDFRNCKQIKIDPPISDQQSVLEKNTELNQADQPKSLERDMLFSADSNPLVSENTYVTDVTSSSSKGEKHLLDSNNILEDQISSESNIEEILPSPTLLLQTSYTTFTYFTTMYGKDSSNIKSRLETVTNVVTETITPNRDLVDESTLPITYYTTFTYWTTLSKDNSTSITSREDIVSNIITPGVTIEPTRSAIDTSPIEIENVVPPVVLALPTFNPIDTTPIDNPSMLAQKELEVQLNSSLINDKLNHDDGKATFYTTYTYFTTFYIGNTSKISSNLETQTSIVDNTKLTEDNQLGRKVQNGAADKNLVHDEDKKRIIIPTSVIEQIIQTASPNGQSLSPAVLSGTYIDNLFAEVKPLQNPSTTNPDKKTIFSQIAIISGDSTIVTNGNNTNTEQSAITSSVQTTENSFISPTSEVIQSSVADVETTTESKITEDEDSTSSRKKGRLTYTKKSSSTPLIRPFASRVKPSYSPKRVSPLSSATTITRSDSTPTITATPTLKTTFKASGLTSGRKQQQQPIGSSSQGKRFTGRSTLSSLSSASKASGSSSRGINIQPSNRPRTGFRASSSLKSNSLDYASRSSSPRVIRPTASLRLRNGRQSVSVTVPPPLEQNESETYGTQQEESATESLEEVTEVSLRTTPNTLLKFRRPPVLRQPGTSLPSRNTTPATKRIATVRGKITTTTKRVTTRSTNPLLALRRERPNSLFPRRNLFKQPEPQPKEVVKEDEQKEAESEELLESEDFNEDNDYDSSDRKEQTVVSPVTTGIKRNTNAVQIKSFRRRAKRQADYGNRKYTNFRRPGTVNSRRSESEQEVATEKTTTSPSTSKKSKVRPGNRARPSVHSIKATSTLSTATKSSTRQPFIVRGESRTTTTTSAPAYRRNKTRTSSRSSSTTSSSKPKTSRLSIPSRSAHSSRTSTARSGKSRTTTGRTSGRRGSFENTSAERFHSHNIEDGKFTITHQIPFQVTVPVVNGKITEYKGLLTATPRVETLLSNQVTTSIGPFGLQQLLLATESTELAENGATRVIKYLLHETPTTTVIFTPTTLRGRKTSYSHILPSTIYNVEPVTSTIVPEINANLPLANLLLSQLLLGNQQPGANPLLGLQGQALLPQQAVVQTPVTELKTRTTTYVTTVTDARETVLPITFRGRAILTTIVDPTTSVITATEFITDTVVTTPTVFAPAGAPPQLNSLLLQQLLLQQQQQQQPQPALLAQLQTPNPLLGLINQPDVNFDQNNNLGDIYSNSPKPNVLSEFNSNEDLSDMDHDDSEEDAPPLPPPPPPSTTTTSPFRARSKSRTSKSKSMSPAHPISSPHHQQQPIPPPSPPGPAKVTSIVTLYVSGRHPGEFSTVLSTVISDETQTVRKREAIYYDDIKVLPSILPTLNEISGSEDDNIFKNAIITDTEKYYDESPTENRLGTQSLESIVGELSKHINYDASPTYVVKLTNPSVTRDLKQSLVDDIS